ncbi:MAG: RNA-directed DNA polymerase [Tannerellaceae bacterium]|nr:RNA-directed DNA polymerase [Tannerellaceae bacterium]
MKRYGNLYERVCSYDNLVNAAENARKGKNRQKTIRDFYSDFENNILKLQRELQTLTFKTSDYSIFTIKEPKERIIYRLPFKDRVVHWAIMLVIEPIWIGYFTRDTYSCIKKRGIHDLQRRLTHDLRSDPEGTAYCLKVDVKKFYPSIDHTILKSIIRRKIKDPELLWLMDEIIDSVPDREGVPIGNYLSQYFANIYLAELDHIIKEELNIRYYYRYSDDLVFLDSSKEKLRAVLVYVNHYLHSERNMTIKSNFQIFPVESRGIDFVGYVTFHEYALVRKRNKQNLCRKLAEYRKKGLSEEQIRLKVASRVGFMIHCNSRNLLKSLNVVEMKKFSDVAKSKGKLEGSKLHIDQILNRVIHLLAYEITDSKHNSEKCVTIQYEIEEDNPQEDAEQKKIWAKHITFTGSKALLGQLEQLEPEDLPCEAKIIKQPIGDGRKCFYKIVDPDD